MKEIVGNVEQWLAAGEANIVLGTVIETWGSSPRKVGAKMAFVAGGAAIAGSVSGGCVEGAVIATGDEVLATGRPQLLRFGVSDEVAWGVGLACGGTIDVFVERLDIATYQVAREWIERRETGAIVTVVRGPDSLFGCKILVSEVGKVIGQFAGYHDMEILALVDASRGSGRQHLTPDIEVFIDIVRPSPRLVIIGGAHIAIALAQLARIMNFRIVVIDPRRAFGSEARFPGVDRIIQAFPDKAFADEPPGSDTAIVTLSHDPKIDDPALRVALNSDAFYIGALGSRKTHANRCARLTVLGFREEQLARIHAPIGLDIGADNPEEIALAIMGEIVAVYRRRQDQDDG